VFLEVLNLSADGPGGDVQLSGGPLEVQMTARRLESAQAGD
jgi:hypothetical protein